MADLKKTCSKPYKLAEFDVDDFIDDVDNYTHGRQSFIFPPQLTVVDGKNDKGMSELSARKNATFSLNIDCIAELNLLAETHQTNKSKLIRALISQFSELSDSEQRAILAQL
ncbi:hypothetical protein [Catenovulum agarivorans]|uniref:hypothetical protein n=1 Tax=Catenovulum agarivorans TaxID=1172192 RepID=UPI00145F2ADB|nr:hypothetical protein [Catenovulum agarivorans]